MSGLKPCPFCGGEIAKAWFRECEVLACNGCAMIFTLQNRGREKELVNKFNTRTPEIVRCGECKRYKEANNKIGVCDLQIDMVNPDYFCSYGERREEDGKRSNR